MLWDLRQVFQLSGVWDFTILKWQSYFSAWPLKCFASFEILLQKRLRSLSHSSPMTVLLSLLPGIFCKFSFPPHLLLHFSFCSYLHWNYSLQTKWWSLGGQIQKPFSPHSINLPEHFKVVLMWYLLNIFLLVLIQVYGSFAFSNDSKAPISASCCLLLL